MPYKRALRVLWVAFEHPEWASEACRAAVGPSDGRIEHRGDADSTSAWQWADLVVTLDDAACNGLPALPARVQVRHLDLGGAADAAARRFRVAARVVGIAGGLRLLDRVADDSDPS